LKPKQNKNPEVLYKAGFPPRIGIGHLDLLQKLNVCIKRKNAI
jgi:hypothetical protein